jgi:hypothetical protein
MPHVQRADKEYGQENEVTQFHITPPFTRPSGPVHPRDVKIQDRRAIIPITVKVIANAKTNG